MPSALSVSEVRYRRLFEASHDGILILDPNTRKILDVNPFLVKFLGYTREEFLGKELYEIGLLQDEAANQAAFRQLRADGLIRYDDLPLKTKDGRAVAVEFVSNLYVEGDGQVIQCNIRDISARKKTETALREADRRLANYATELEAIVKERTADLQSTTDQLRNSNAQLETFVYSIAHDLRAPLRGMQGFSQLISEEEVNMTQRGRDFARMIDIAAQTMDQLLSDLLAFSRVSQLDMRLTPVSLEWVVEGALRDCGTEIRTKNAEVKNIGPWPEVMADEATLRQVLVNLIGNALKFVVGRPPQLRLSSEDRPAGMLRIWVKDNGIGITEYDQRRVFEVFQRLHSGAYPGTGIGLAIVKKGIERMGGQVGVISVPNEGSRFWIELANAVPVLNGASCLEVAL